MAEKHEGKEESNSLTSKRTIFVRNLPFETTNQQLEELFSDEAPIKRAFVVKDKDNHTKCRGFGYVQFVLQDDADKAVKSNKTFNNRKLVLCHASKKPKHEKRKQQKEKGKENVNGEDGENDGNNNTVKQVGDHKFDSEPVKTVKKVKKKKPKGNKNSATDPEKAKQWTEDKSESQRTVVITGLPSEVQLKDLEDVCKRFGEVDDIQFPVPDRDVPTAFVKYKDYRNTVRATQKIPGVKLNNTTNVLFASLLTKENTKPSKKVLTKSRVIVRNLSFKCDERDLRDVFSKYGKVLDVHIPTKTVKGRSVKVGCAFVQFTNQSHGKAAVENMNMKEIKGRNVVVDWAIGKEEYGSKQNQSARKSTKTEFVDMKEEESSDNEAENNADETQPQRDSKKLDESDEEANSDSETEEQDDDESGGENEGAKETGEIEEHSESEASDGNDDDEVKEEEEEMENVSAEEYSGLEENEMDKEQQERINARLKDAKEGKTIFIRNLSYNTEDDSLEEEFEKYGEIEYCKIVYDKETGHSKGCAFLKFKEKVSAEKCVEEYEKLTNAQRSLVIDGRSIVVSKAVTRGKIEEIQREKTTERKETDRRNLYLAYEGVITSKSPGADSLSEADLKKREKALEEKKTKLKNPQYFVSRTRLCVRNIPLACDSNELREKMMGELGEESNDVKVTEIKIARNKDRRDATGQARSLGYGFIEVNTHEGALKLLRATNNNPDVFGPERRPIVEFSVENSKALRILELKRQKMNNHQKQLQQGTDNSTGGGWLVQGTTNKMDFTNPEQRKLYKSRAREHRYKRQLRYQKKRKERQKSQQKNEATNKPSEDQNHKNEPKKMKNQKQKNFQNAATTKTPKNPNRTMDKMDLIEKAYTAKSRKRNANDSAGDLQHFAKRTRKNEKAKKDEAKFSSLLQQYRNKLSGNVKKGRPKKTRTERWFNS